MTASRPKAPERKPLTVVDLFSGVGGFTLGFLKARGEDGQRLFDPRLLVDVDKEAAFTFKSNHPEIPFLVRDLKTVSADDIKKYARVEQVDVVVGGPPCQGFSMNGKRLFDDERNQLLKDFVRLVAALRPKVALMENVPSLLGAHGAHAEEVEQKLSEAGFDSDAMVLQATDYGVPQIRRRAFFIAFRKDLEIAPSFPTPTTAESDFVSAEDAIGDLPVLQSGEGQDACRYPGPATTAYQRARRGTRFLLFNHLARKHAKWFLDKISVIPEGGGNQTLDPEQQFSDSYFSQAYARLTRTKPAYTITTSFLNPGSGRFIHYRDCRSITSREAARFQSFDDDFIFHGPAVAQERHIGNAVPPMLSHSWAKHIAAVLDGTAPAKPQPKATEKSKAKSPEKPAVNVR